MDEEAATLSPWRRVSLAGLVLLVGGGGLMHFVVPETYALIVPDWLGNRLAWVYASGVAEFTCGVLLVIPRTRRIGAVATMVVLVVVFPGNIKMALDSGLPTANPPLRAPLISWLRLPLQAVFIWWAWTFARPPRPDASPERQRP